MKYYKFYKGILLVTILLLSMVMTTNAEEPKKGPKVFLDDKELEFKGACIIQDGNIYVPAKEYFDNLGFAVKFNVINEYAGKIILPKSPKKVTKDSEMDEIFYIDLKYYDGNKLTSLYINDKLIKNIDVNKIYGSIYALSYCTIYGVDYENDNVYLYEQPLVATNFYFDSDNTEIIKTGVTMDSSNKPIATIVFHSKTDKTISEFKINFECYDAYDRPVNKFLGKSNIAYGIAEGVELKPWEDTYFQWPLNLYGLATKIMYIEVESVTFTDGTVWKAPER